MAKERATASPVSSVVSLFSGAGGLDEGLRLAGWNLLAQVEMDADCAATLRANAANHGATAKVLQSRIEDVDAGKLRRDLGLRKGDLWLLAGGPPCQPFTTHGRRRGVKDKRVDTLFPSYLKFLAEFLPRSFLFENVDGLLSAALRHRPLARRGKNHDPLRPAEKKGSFLRWLLGEFSAMGYSVSWGVLEAADFGVPQMRQRAILIGVRGESACPLPVGPHGPGRLPYRTLREALADVKEPGPIQPLSTRKKAVFDEIPPGGNWRSLSLDRQKRTMGKAFEADGGKGGWWRRLAWDDPSPTIIGMPDHSSTGLIHPDQTRCLSTKECAALQTFSPDYEFVGTPRSIYQQIGNAVPVELGKALALHLSRFLMGEPQAELKEPAWRRESANRRIGTHGIAQSSLAGKPSFQLLVRIRADHIWADGNVAKEPASSVVT